MSKQWFSGPKSADYDLTFNTDYGYYVRATRRLALETINRYPFYGSEEDEKRPLNLNALSCRKTWQILAGKICNSLVVHVSVKKDEVNSLPL